MDSTQKPNVSVDLNDLISGLHESNSPSQKLSVMIPQGTSTDKTDDGEGGGTVKTITGASTSSTVKLPLIDLPHTDILGPSEVIKQLLTLPSTPNNNDYFAIHRLGNTLVLDIMPDMMGKEYTQNGKNTPKRLSHEKSRNPITNSTLPSEENVLEKLNIDNFNAASSAAALTSAFEIKNSLESVYLPPPEYYMPNCTESLPQPFRQVLRWQVRYIFIAFPLYIWKIKFRNL